MKIIIMRCEFFQKKTFIKHIFRLNHQQNYYRFSYLLTSALRHRCPHASLALDESLTVPASLSASVPRTLLIN